MFLDIASDRYFALGAAASEACSELIAGRAPSASDAKIIRSLIAGGVLLKTGEEVRPSLCVATAAATRALPGHEGATFRFDDMAGLLRYLNVLAALRFSSLSAVLDQVARAKRRLRADRDRTDAAARVAAAFARIDRLIGSGGRCLPRSITIVRMLIARHAAADLVIGVKLRPFEAHCWVRQGDTVVGDTLANIAPFTPIFVL